MYNTVQHDRYIVIMSMHICNLIPAKQHAEQPLLHGMFFYGKTTHGTSGIFCPQLIGFYY